MFMILAYKGYQDTQELKIFFVCHSKVTDDLEYYI